MKQVLIALDQLVNTLFGGWADETLSSRAYRKHKRLMKWIDRLFFWQKHHCFSAYMSEKRRLQSPPETR